MEKLLHYCWKHRLWPLGQLRTTEGAEVEVIDPGLHNRNAGPDFVSAKVKVDGTLWVGCVELHLRSSDWQRHGHHTDAAYNNVILHVVERADADVFTLEGRRLPQLELPIAEAVRANYDHLCQTDDYPRCWPVVPQLSQLTVHSWMSALLCERLEERAHLCLERVRVADGDWERALFQTLARNFGFGVNGDAFELWARHFPLHAAAKHRDDLFQLEALCLGTAGLLAENALPPSARQLAPADSYFQRLQHEYAYLAHKFQLPEPMGHEHWRYLRLRPQNFPHLRLVQLAALYHQGTAGLASLLEAATREQLHQALTATVSDYWQTHYLFGLDTPRSNKHLSAASLDLLIINTVCPMLFAHGTAHANEDEQERAVGLLEQLKPERNFIIRQWQQCGLNVQTAADSQALIQLKRQYCDRHDCLRCRFAYDYLQTNPTRP